MFRAIYFTDTHYGCRPLTRKDNYNESILKKLEWIFNLAKKNNCIVLHGGDLFDKPNILLTDLIPLVNLFRKYNDLQIYSIRGNEGHDGLEELSPLEFLKITGMIKNNDEYVDFKDTRIFFQNHGESIKEDIDQAKVNMILTHEMIVKEPVIFEHLLIKDVETNCKVVFLADYHPKQGVITREDGVIFVSSGSLARRKRIKNDIEKKPTIIYVCIKEGVPIFKELEVPCETDIWIQRDIEDIFDDAYIAILEEEIKKMKETIDIQINTLSLEDFIKLFAKNTSVKEEILNMSLERIRKV